MNANTMHNDVEWIQLWGKNQIVNSAPPFSGGGGARDSISR